MDNQNHHRIEVYDRRRSQGDLLIPAIKLHEAKLGRTSRRVVGDAAFYSIIADNVINIACTTPN